MTSFVGLFGWNDTGLPDPLVYFYLLAILLVALTDINKEIKIGWRQKTVLISIFLVCLVIIETGLYLYSNLVGTDFIVGVQGRYFIPLAPLFILFFYQPFFFYKYNKVATHAKKYGKINPIVTSGRSNTNNVQNYYMPWILIIVAIFAFIYSVLLIINRFYII